MAVPRPSSPSSSAPPSLLPSAAPSSAASFRLVCFPSTAAAAPPAAACPRPNAAPALSGSSSPEDLLDQIRARCQAVTQRQTITYDAGLKIITGLIKRLEKAKKSLAKRDSHSVAEKLCDQLLEEKSHIMLSREFKELYGTVLSLGNSIDRNLKRESEVFFETPERAENIESSFGSKDMAGAMIYSLMRRGRFAVADSIAQEMKMESPVLEKNRKALEQMNVCSQALENKDIYPALRWTQAQERETSELKEACNRNCPSNSNGPHNKLQRKESLRGKRKSIVFDTSTSNEKQGAIWKLNRWEILRDLHFQLLKLRYLQLIQQENSNVNSSSKENSIPLVKREANHKTSSGSSTNSSCLVRPIEFARKELSKFAGDRQRDMERLAGALLFANDLQNSPYRDLYNVNSWKEVRVQFEAAFCQAHGFAGRDPLVIATLASDVALPKRAKYAAVLRSGKGLVEQKDRPPPEINLAKSLQFHSTFVCPISKEQSTASNPPVLLSCGHVISRDAMVKITRTRRNNRVKCPTCPTETCLEEVKEIVF